MKVVEKEDVKKEVTQKAKPKTKAAPKSKPKAKPKKAEEEKVVEEEKAVEPQKEDKSEDGISKATKSECEKMFKIYPNETELWVTSSGAVFTNKRKNTKYYKK